MANELDELTGPVNQEGRDINVINKQLSPKIGAGSVIFEVLLWILGIIPGIIFLCLKVKANNYFQKIQQKIQANASTIDNCLEQRVRILQNAADLLGKSIKLDKEVFLEVAKARSGGNMNLQAAKLEEIQRSFNLSFERYPELKSHQNILECMQQNAYLQKEITAARDLYNDSVYEWNSLVMQWPSYKIVAARKGYTTRIPFIVSAEVKAQARGQFFKE